MRLFNSVILNISNLVSVLVLFVLTAQISGCKTIRDEEYQIGIKHVDSLIETTEDLDSRLSNLEQALKRSQELDYKNGQAHAFKYIGLHYFDWEEDYFKAEQNLKESLVLFEVAENTLEKIDVQLELAHLYHFMGEDIKAIDYAMMSLQDAQTTNDSSEIGAMYRVVGSFYSDLESPDEARKFYRLSIEYLPDGGVSYHSLGSSYMDNNEPREALKYLEKSLDLYPETEGYFIAIVLNKIGACYNELAQYQMAQNYFQEALKVASESYNIDIKADAIINLGVTFLGLNKPEKALRFFDRGLENAFLLKRDESARDALFGLYKANKLLNNRTKALSYHEQYLKISDSLNLAATEEMKASLIDIQLKKRDYENQNVEFQLQRKEDQQAKTLLYIGIGLLALILLGLTNRFFFMRKTNKKISEEKDRSDALLNNILPEETAEELKANGSIKAKQFDQITVLFTDFKGFSVIAESISPEKLVDSVDYYFRHFDGIVEKHGLEKIKTIGDAYMCAGGLPKPNETHPEDVLKAAIEMRDFVEETKQNPPPNIHPFEIRIGLNTGPVVAGVVGVKKFAYDIWGSTVNFAARMESKSEPGRINVSESTYELLKDKYDFTYRGEVEVKNGQILKMYFAEDESQVIA